MPLRSTARTSLVDLVIEQMESLIADGEWPVGTKIPAEPLLVEQLDVGRNTVREAVRALVHTGMLEPRLARERRRFVRPEPLEAPGMAVPVKAVAGAFGGEPGVVCQGVAEGEDGALHRPRLRTDGRQQLVTP